MLVLNHPLPPVYSWMRLSGLMDKLILYSRTRRRFEHDGSGVSAAVWILKKLLLSVAANGQLLIFGKKKRSISPFYAVLLQILLTIPQLSTLYDKKIQTCFRVVHTADLGIFSVHWLSSLRHRNLLLGIVSGNYVNDITEPLTGVNINTHLTETNTMTAIWQKMCR